MANMHEAEKITEPAEEEPRQRMTEESVEPRHEVGTISRGMQLMAEESEEGFDMPVIVRRPETEGNPVTKKEFYGAFIKEAERLMRNDPAVGELRRKPREDLTKVNRETLLRKVYVYEKQAAETVLQHFEKERRYVSPKMKQDIGRIITTARNFEVISNEKQRAFPEKLSGALDPKIAKRAMKQPPNRERDYIRSGLTLGPSGRAIRESKKAQKDLESQDEEKEGPLDLAA